MKRKSLPSESEHEVIINSARRCALCFGLRNDFSEQDGQIAHLDKNRDNHSASNLAFLCLYHHNRYDSRSSQSKGYKLKEVKHYRDQLYTKVEKKLRRDQIVQSEMLLYRQRCNAVHKVEEQFLSLDGSLGVLTQQILARFEGICEFNRRALEFPYPDGEFDPEADFLYAERVNKLRDSLSIPKGVYGLIDIQDLTEALKNTMEWVIPRWICGECEYDECTELLDLVDEDLDLDLHWMLFGIPNSDLPPLGHLTLSHFVYIFGMRGLSETRKNTFLDSDD